jgi:hypothetical protein
MRLLSLFPVLFVLGTAGHALAQDSLFAALEGHSVIVDLREEVATPRGTFEFLWRDRVYISTKGRIFHRFDVRSTHPILHGQRELVSDGGPGRGGKYIWTGNALTRQWVNKIGVLVRQTIAISRSQSGFTCHMTVERPAGGRGQVIDRGQTCRVVRGNVLAGQS